MELLCHPPRGTLGLHGTKALAPLAAHLEHLDLSGSATLTSEALGCLLQRRGAEGCGAGLRRLLLRSCDDAVTDELLAAFLPRAHALEHLDVSFCTALTDITARLLSSGKARGLRRLRSVDVSNCRRITQRGLDALRNASDLIDKSEVINNTFEPEWDDFNVMLDLSDRDDESILLVRVVQDDDILCSVKLHGDDLFRAPAHRLYYKMENHLQMPGTDEKEQDMILIALRVEYIIETSVDRAFAATRSKIKDAAATLQATTASSYDLAAKKASERLRA